MIKMIGGTSACTPIPKGSKRSKIRIKTAGNKKLSLG
jgi:hypothetical protein